MEIDKTDIEWLAMMILMLFQKFPINIKIIVKGKKKPRKKPKKPKKPKECKPVKHKHKKKG